MREKILRESSRPHLPGLPELDYVVVNDGSKDDTVAICRRQGYNFIDPPVNLGLAGCFQTGMKYAWQKGYNYAVIV